jgi:hypothetical protein
MKIKSNSPKKDCEFLRGRLNIPLSKFRIERNLQCYWPSYKIDMINLKIGKRKGKTLK